VSLRFIYRTLLLFALTCQVVYADFKSGSASAKVGDFATAYEQWLPLAEQGDAASQFNIGLLHSKQLVTEASPEQAVKWYLRAANNNHTHAQFNLGIKYDKGQTLNYLSKLRMLPTSVIQRLYYLKGGALTHRV
jgi:TPR repeat protein